MHVWLLTVNLTCLLPSPVTCHEWASQNNILFQHFLTRQSNTWPAESGFWSWAKLWKLGWSPLRQDWMSMCAARLVQAIPVLIELSGTAVATGGHCLIAKLYSAQVLCHRAVFSMNKLKYSILNHVMDILEYYLNTFLDSESYYCIDFSIVIF